MWELNIYNIAAKLLEPLVDLETRWEAIYDAHVTVAHNVIVRQDEYSVSAPHCEIIAHFVAKKHMYLCDVATLVEWTMHLVDLCDSIRSPKFETLAYALMQLLGIPVRKATISAIVFPALLNETFDIGRKTRLDLRRDTSLYLFLTTKFRNRSLGSVMEESEYTDWLNTACSLEDIGALTYSYAERRKVASSLQWKKQRKRKRTLLDVSDEYMCGICLERKKVRRTRCDHHFCVDCLGKWNKGSCPICREII